MWEVKQFKDLTKDEIFQMYKLRSEVFVVEQDRLYQDVDDIDLTAYHLLNLEDNILKAYARIFPEDDHISFGRVVVSKQKRGTGLGGKLVTKILETIKNEFPNQNIEIHAEDYVQHFYEKFGFKRIGEVIIFNNSPHVKMVLKNQPALKH
ncbi:GNAT family N-acetyltransferase [Companilactobacillus mishanensis]|uniref:GNAT family N-acetyltransferase n=1 Tax=Companilactobacillus mishanensis TaxID=2486008 RepID=UPI001297E735|nr:GNAT family N-acetyltransferase [Companilactobacillus mishanensis]MQS88898.1 GNAT family N-acetyltransferase [Companilactobacillus mishanensis]